MRSQTWRILMLFTLTLVLVAGALDAQAARRSSLAGNQFIDDPDDMFAFPQLVTKYKNRLIIDMEPGAGDAGNGSVVFGDQFVWNFNTGRGSYLNNTAYWAWGGADRYFGSFGWDVNGIPGNNGSNGSTLEWWDLGFGTSLGEIPFGVNLSWAKDNYKETPATGGATVDLSSNMFSVQLGATLGTVELAGEVGFGDYKQKAPDLAPLPQDSNDYSFFNVSLLARGRLEDVGGLDWRWIAAFMNGSNDPKLADAQKLSTTGFRASFGPVWGTPRQWEVAAYLNFDYLSHEMEGDNPGVKDTGSYTSFPAYNFAMEYYVTSWLVARGGIASHNATDTFKQEVPAPGTGESETKARNYDFMWTMGLGVDKSSWGVDLALNEADVHSGYLPLNGTVSDSPIAYLTAWLAW